MNRITDGYDFIQRHSWDTLAQLPEIVRSLAPENPS